MDKYISPEIEIIIFSDVDIMSQSSDAVENEDGIPVPHVQS